jgi:NAD(P)-dependent dehydrogenase (short-subunit alcohol dehydrogenase family)
MADKPPGAATQPYEVSTQCRRYEGRVVVVTGAAQGLGRVIARRVAEEGARVVVADLAEERVKRTAEKLEAETGMSFAWVGGDLSQPHTADAMVARALDEFGRVDTLVNNAAALIRKRLPEFSEELLQQAVDGNVWTTLRCCKAVLPTMLERGYGRIVNIGGEAWRLGTPFHTLLGGVGKGSMVGLTATLAGETVRNGITVNCVSPGGIDSASDGDDGNGGGGQSAARDPSWTPPEILEELMASAVASPGGMGRLAHPTEIASAVAFLGSPEASFVTGQHLGASGGLAMI